MEKRETRLIRIGEKDYRYLLIYSSKRRRGATLSLRKDGSFCLRAPFGYSKDGLDDFVVKAVPRLLRRAAKRKERKSPYGEGYLYLFGQKTINDAFYLLSKREQDGYLKEALTPYIASRLPALMKEVGNKEEVSFLVKPLKSAFGIFHKKKRIISFSSVLAHYSPRAIDSLIAHELTHDFVTSHGPSFYARLLKAFPEYWECRKELINQEYEGKDNLSK